MTLPDIDLTKIASDIARGSIGIIDGPLLAKDKQIYRIAQDYAQ